MPPAIPDGESTLWAGRTVLVSLPVLVSLLVLLAAAACGTEPRENDLPASFVRVLIDESDPERLLRYYLGGYVQPEPSDPFDAGLVEQRGGRFYLNVDSLEDRRSSGSVVRPDSDGNGRIEWEEFERFVRESYHAARGVPRDLNRLREAVAFDRSGSGWMHVSLHGVMTTARREIYIEEAAVRYAVAHYLENGRRLLYPIGTTIFGEHLMDGRRRETTVMRKRADGLWDFIVYGANDSLAEHTATPPRSLESPTQCVGCHFGDKIFEPERSFPAPARPGPHGPRRIYVSDALRDVEVVRYFDEHRKRSDTVLGLYSTLFVSALRAKARTGQLGAEDAALLDALEL